MIFTYYIFGWRFGIRRLCSCSERLPARLKKRKIVYYRTAVSIKPDKWLDFIRFLQLFYVGGQNLYPLVLQYAGFMKGVENQIYILIADQLLNGRGLVNIVSENKLISKKWITIMRIQERTSSEQGMLEELVVTLEDERKRMQRMIARMSYPAVLLFMVCAVSIGVSVLLIPVIRGLYEMYSIPVSAPLRLMSWPFSGLFLAVTGVALLLLVWTYNRNRLRIGKIVGYPKHTKILFELQLLWLLQGSIRHAKSLMEVIEPIIDENDDVITRFYLSRIFYKLKQGIPLEQALLVPVIRPTVRIFASAALAGGITEALLTRAIRSRQDELNSLNDKAAGAISLVLTTIVGLLVSVIGYLLVVPIQQVMTQL